MNPFIDKCKVTPLFQNIINRLSNSTHLKQKLEQNKPMLSAMNLAKRFGNRDIVSDVSLNLSMGEIVGLLGPNGAGKSTCFGMMLGLIKPDKGVITVGGANITRVPVHIRARRGIAYLPQEASVFRKLSVADNILAILELRNDLGRAARDAKMEELLDEFGIGHLRYEMGLALSGGERRKLEIARALALDPHFILLDEPFAGVDPISVQGIRESIEYLRDRGLGVLITDHNVRDALSICKRSYVLSNGFIIAEGDSESIISNEKVKEFYLGNDFSLSK